MNLLHAIAIQNLRVWYSDAQAIHDASITIPERTITAFIGPSGSGKSTVLRSMNRILDVIPSSRIEGSIMVHGTNVYSAETDPILLRRMVGMVFQNPVPFAKSIYDNIAYGLEIQGIDHPRKQGPFSSKKRLSAETVENSLHTMDAMIVRSLKQAALWDEVKHRLHLPAHRLSGGQQQRLCIARALAVQPKILLLDEPCSSLDPISTHLIEQTLQRLKDEYTIVIVTHNLQQARRIADVTAFFHQGRLMEAGDTKTIFENPREDITRQYVQGQFG